MNKKIVFSPVETQPFAEWPWLDLESLARLELTSEDSQHPIEAALRATGEGWRAAQPGTQTILIKFGAPQAVRQIQVSFSIGERRTHEFTLGGSADGVLFREIARQQFNFSPATTSEEENYFPNLGPLTDLKLTIVPDISDANVHATLKALRLR